MEYAWRKVSVEDLPEKRLLRRRLAHIKYIPPEAVRIDNVSADGERKRSVLKIGLLFNVVVGHGGDSVFVALRILFDPRLREFHAAHPEYLKSRVIPPTAQDESLPSNRQNLESYLDPQPLTPPERYPVPTTALESEEDATFMHYGFQSIKDNKEFLVVTRNSLDILSSILNSETEPKPIKDELTVSMLEKCKQSLPVVQRIIETTSDDEDIKQIKRKKNLLVTTSEMKLLYQFKEKVTAKLKLRLT
ncbi:TOM1-like protein 2 isoform X2 [Primulina eburnea]|uniref:TOM1-like protein 2 isoform X2 n=1 Tax=Primulina eburnea TaxID=1245227 RepID=UPI003C6CAE21